MEGVTVAASRGRSHRNQTDAACCLGVRAARAFSQLRAYRHGRYREVQNFR
uniref:Uncharacterized protein n=1 Tax=Oryza glaberrima TaxID=4538 RepID=I1QS01_ORYGL